MWPIWLKINLETFKTVKRIPGIFSTVIPYHLLALFGILISCYNWQWIYLLYFVCGWILFGGIGAVIMLHKYASHRSLEIRSKLKPLLYVISCMSGQGSSIWWSALHRGYHHAHSDRERDIHSPIHGIWNSYMGWMFYIGHESVNLKYAGSLLKDPMAVWFHNNYNKVLWTIIPIGLLLNPMFFLWFCIIPSVYSLHMDCLVNWICHTPKTGYRNFDVKDLSQNVWYLGMLHWGQGWHNNHHYKSNIFNFGYGISNKWYEFDPSLLLVPLVSTWEETKRVWNFK